MQFITVREFRSSTAKTWRRLKKERQLIVTSRGKPVAIVTATDEQRLGDTLLSISRQEALVALDQLQAEAKAKGLSGMPMSEIDDIIAESRRERRLRRK